MNFTRASDWHQVSECGRYTVAAGRVNGVFNYTAHCVADKDNGSAGLLGAYRTAEEARARCQWHAEAGER